MTKPTTFSTFQIDALLRRIARTQLGLLTTTQAKALGVDARALSRRRAVGATVTVFAGVMRLGSVPSSPAQRILAASLAVPGSVIAATSAALLHGMPVRETSADRPTVFVDNGRSARMAGITVVRSSHRVPSSAWLGCRIATPVATIVQLPRFVDGNTLERCLDHCLARRLVTVRAVRSLLDQLPAQAVPGRRVLIELLDDRSEGMGHRSGLEQRVARWLRESGLRGWKRNVCVPVGAGFVEVDFGWAEQGVALEVSPFFTHGSRLTQERDAERRRLLLAARWRVVEATDRDLVDRRAFAECVASLRALLAP